MEGQNLVIFIRQKCEEYVCEGQWVPRRERLNARKSSGQLFFNKYFL